MPITHPQSDCRPRLTIDITEEQHAALKRHLPWGVQNKLFRLLVEDLLLVLEQHGGLALGMLLTKQLKARDISSALKDLRQED